MKKIVATILCLGTFSAGAADLDEAGRLDRMHETLQKKGVDVFMEAVRDNGWKMPRIPPKWFADTRAANDEERRQMRAARDFGYQLAVQLDKLALEQQTLPPENGLYRRAQLLCDTGNWLTETAGYGNVFLARRCLDFAAVGLARLTASLDFPVADCEKLAARMSPEWMEMAYCLQVLNGEAGTNLFVNASVTNEELDWQWAIGWTMRAMAEKTTLIKKTERPNAAFVNIQAFTNNLGFFASYEYPQSPVTLLRSWDLRQHRLIAIGLELQSVKKALALLEYRTVVGFFPNKFVRSEEERLQLEKDMRESAKRGLKITPIERDSSFDPIKESFRRHGLPVRTVTKKKPTNTLLLFRRIMKSQTAGFMTPIRLKCVATNRCLSGRRPASMQRKRPQRKPACATRKIRRNRENSDCYFGGCIGLFCWRVLVLAPYFGQVVRHAGSLNLMWNVCRHKWKVLPFTFSLASFRTSAKFTDMSGKPMPISFLLRRRLTGA